MTAQAGSVTSSTLAVQAERLALRRHAFRVRRALPQPYRRSAAEQLAAQFDHYRLLKPKLRIGVYLATPNELDLKSVIARALRRHCTLYVPHIVNFTRRQMCFIPLLTTSRLQRHRLGMPHITGNPRHHIPVQQLDLVLVPTVAFDAQGHRLGMGAGFYDRHFSYLRHRRWQRPRLIGVAYSIQQVAHIPTYVHDINLPHVITEHRLIECQQPTT